MFTAKFERIVDGVSHYEVKPVKHLASLHNYLKEKNELIRDEEDPVSPIFFTAYGNGVMEFRARDHKGNELKLLWVKFGSTTVYHRNHFCSEKFETFLQDLKTDIDKPMEYGEY